MTDLVHHGVMGRRRRSGWLLRLLVLVLLVHIGQAALAEPMHRALLIGVSELPGQPESTWLRAPRNDVQLMRSTLVAQGWPAAGIQTIADGVAGAALPRLDVIRAALSGLVRDAAPGEVLLLYFSGHGVRLHGQAKRYQEPDGLTEVFLARDGGLRDAELGSWIQALLAKGVFVWSVFDTCSATSMTRGGLDLSAGAQAQDPASDIRFRGLASADLGAAVRQAARAATPDAERGPPETAFVPPARYVAFFAAESHQLTPELRLPRGQRDARPQGLLTWAITAALQRRPTTWRMLFNDVLALYGPVMDELGGRFPDRELPSPVAEGVLDHALFDGRSLVASTRPSWPAKRQADTLAVAAGLLDGLMPGQALRVTAWLTGGSSRDAMATADTVHLEDARISVPTSLAALPEGALWQVRPLEAPPELALRVHTNAGAGQDGLSGLSLDYPSSVRLVPKAKADLSITARATGFAVNDLGAGSVRVVPDAIALRRYVADRATARWLDALAQLPARIPMKPLPGFKATLVADGNTGGEPRQELLAARPSLPVRGAAIEIENASGASVDLLIVGIAADGRVLPTFPRALGETNRFERGDASVPARKRFALPPELASRGAALLVVATPVRPRSPTRLYGFSPSVDAASMAVALRGPTPDTGDMAYVVMARW